MGQASSCPAGSGLLSGKSAEPGTAAQLQPCLPSQKPVLFSSFPVHIARGRGQFQGISRSAGPRFTCGTVRVGSCGVASRAALGAKLRTVVTSLIKESNSTHSSLSRWCPSHLPPPAWHWSPGMRASEASSLVQPSTRRWQSRHSADLCGGQRVRWGPDTFVTWGGSTSGRDQGKWTSGRTLLLCCVGCHSGPLDMLAVTWARCSTLSLGSVFWVPRPPLPFLVQGERALSPRERG